jgi:hypothetical protein
MIVMDSLIVKKVPVLHIVEYVVHEGMVQTETHDHTMTHAVLLKVHGHEIQIQV